MPNVKYIRDAKEKNILFLGVSEDEDITRYTLTRAEYAELGMPAVGETLTEDELDEIKLCDERYRAKKKALSLLALSDNNRRTLFQKLVHAGFSRRVSEECVCEMVMLGYVNENRQIERLILAEAKKLRGPRRILASLSAKGYRMDDLRRVMTYLEEIGELDFFELEGILLKKKLPPDATAEEKKKLLYKQGF